MNLENPFLTINEITAQSVLNWLLPSLGGIAAFLVILFVWRYLRHSNEAGRVSEFNERTFKKIVETEGSAEDLPFCEKCKLPMRVEIKYKDFLQDSGEFTIDRDSIEEMLVPMVKSGRITEENREMINDFFKKNSSITQQTFRRYKCPHCSKVIIKPYTAEKTAK